jgi:hypothetical protein
VITHSESSQEDDDESDENMDLRNVRCQLLEDAEKSDDSVTSDDSSLDVNHHVWSSSSWNALLHGKTWGQSLIHQEKEVIRYLDKSREQVEAEMAQRPKYQRRSSRDYYSDNGSVKFAPDKPSRASRVAEWGLR